MEALWGAICLIASVLWIISAVSNGNREYERDYAERQRQKVLDQARSEGRHYTEFM